ncbi:MAG: lasso peptide biosynthesis B2 protein [Acidimicrobiia bacterium]
MGKMRLAAVIARRYVRVRLDLRRYPLPELVSRYSRLQRAPNRHQVRTLRRGVDRLLKLPGRPLRCLPRALVLYSLVVEQNHNPRLVLGLPQVGDSNRAHAWVEIDGIDVGPSPGRDGHEPLAVYPLAFFR